MKTRIALLSVLAVLAAACSGDQGVPAGSVTSTSTAPTTTTTVGDTTTTTSGEDTTTTSTTVPETTTTTTFDLPTTEDPSLTAWAGLFRQPADHGGFLDFQATGVLRAGYDHENLDQVGLWDYNAATEQFLITHLDFGTGCGDDVGRYKRENAPGGGRLITLVEDPCEARVAFMIHAGSTCECLIYLKVEIPEEDPGSAEDADTTTTTYGSG